jgi:Tol biopolymer transport system component
MTHNQEDMRMTRSLTTNGRRVVLTAIAAVTAIAATLGLAAAANAKMVFISNRAADLSTDFEIWTANDNGSSPVQVTSNAFWDERPSLSSDGTKIVFASKRNNNWDIYSMNVNGTNEVRLTTEAATETRPVWSPDGTKIAYQKYANGNYDIYVMNANGTGTPTQITTDTHNDIAPAWSSTAIAFATDRNGNYDIYRMSSTGAANTVNRLTNNSQNEFDPSWYDSTHVDYTRNPPNNGTNRDIYEVTAPTSGLGSVDQITSTSTRDECDAVRKAGSGDLVYTNLSTGNADIWDVKHNGSSAGSFGSLSTSTSNDQQVAFQGQ